MQRVRAMRERLDELRRSGDIDGMPALRLLLIAMSEAIESLAPEVVAPPVALVETPIFVCAACARKSDAEPLCTKCTENQRKAGPLWRGQ